MSTYQTLFTPIFIIIALSICIAGIVGLQVLDRLFAGSSNLTTIRLFAISNKGRKGDIGAPGGLQICGNNYQTVEEKKSFEKSLNYLDLKAPLINNS
jgi:hypothetical protein